ncbi:hypothetical protein CC202_16005 [Pseudomonas savastanoi]|nr:hypothetical protein [Pseudomonas savastanoi]PAB29686.1 hypothetical protein CC202_16005 [Pseudomonas savastanoi]
MITDFKIPQFAAAGCPVHAHEDYVSLACGESFEKMADEIKDHGQRGLEKVVASLKAHQG